MSRRAEDRTFPRPMAWFGWRVLFDFTVQLSFTSLYGVCIQTEKKDDYWRGSQVPKPNTAGKWQVRSTSKGRALPLKRESSPKQLYVVLSVSSEIPLFSRIL